jgi:hypothetical protein
MKNILIIHGGSPQSANLAVMLAVLHSFNDIRIHVIECGNIGGMIPKDSERVKYYAINDRWHDMVNKIQSYTKRDIKYIFDDLHLFLENIILFRFEREQLKICEDIINRYNIDDVFSVSNPISSHKISNRLRKKYPQLHYGQFWVDQFIGRKKHTPNKIRLLLYHILESQKKKLEKKLLMGTEKVYMLPEITANDNIAVQFKDKLCYFEIPYITNREVAVTTDDVIFAGFLGGYIRQPKPMLNIILEALPMIKKDITFRFFVNDPDSLKSYETKSGGKLSFSGYINRDELNDRLSNSFMLLTIGNKGSNQMPSKTVEYIGYRKPVLFFYADDKDTSLRYFNYYPDVCMIDVRKELKENSHKLASFVNAEHGEIAYEDLMKVKVFRDSTPEKMKEIITI